jgi:hypothetical protein
MELSKPEKIWPLLAHCAGRIHWRTLQTVFIMTTLAVQNRKVDYNILKNSNKGSEPEAPHREPLYRGGRSLFENPRPHNVLNS